MESARRCVACGATYAGDERFCSKCGGTVDDDIVGKTIDGRYRVVRLLGRGGMGAVYEAEHAALERRVAIKVMTGGADGESLSRFRREARAASRISNEHVVQIFDVGTFEGRDYIAMEYVEGTDLRGVLEGGALPIARAVSIARQMLAALAAIHDAGIVHRDIKPANVLVRAGDAVKVMDFGIAKTARGTDTTLTAENQVIGTPHFMAPEQVAGEVVDLRADLYAVGVTLYAMLAGVVPFDGNSFTQIAMLHLTEPPPPLAAKRPETPPHVVAAVERALSKAPPDRFATAGDFAAALSGELPSASRAKPTPLAGDAPTVKGPASKLNAAEAATVAMPTTGRSPTVAPDSTGSRRRLGAVAIVAALAVVVVSGLVIVMMSTRTSAGQQADTPPDAAGRPVVSADASGDPPGSLATQQLAVARDAENRGDLELALAAYLEVERLQPGADPLYRIAELYDRLGKPTEAAQYLRKYLAAAPSASDRSRIEARIAKLEPEKGSGSGSGSGSNAATRAPRPQVPPASAGGQKCMCFLSGQSACPKVTTASCSCLVNGLAHLCFEPWVECAKGEAFCSGVKCSREQAAGSAGAACTGYYGGTPPSNDKVTGVFDCDYCPTTTPAELRIYPGPDGSACQAYDRATGTLARGQTGACK